MKTKKNNESTYLIIFGTILISLFVLYEFLNGDFGSKYSKFKSVDNLVGLCGMHIGDSKTKVDDYLFKKLKSKPKEYTINEITLSEKYQAISDTAHYPNATIRISLDEVNYVSDTLELDELKTHLINNGKYIDIVTGETDDWEVTEGLNLVVYDVRGLKIKDYLLDGLRLVFYNNKLIHIQVYQNSLGGKLFDAKYGVYGNIKNGDIVATNESNGRDINDSNTFYDSYEYPKLLIYDSKLTKLYKEELKEKQKLNLIKSNKQLLKDYNEY